VAVNNKIPRKVYGQWESYLLSFFYQKEHSEYAKKISKYDYDIKSSKQLSYFCCEISISYFDYRLLVVNTW